MDRTRALAVAAAFVLACCALAWWSGRRTSGVGPLNNPTDTVFVGTTRRRREDEDLSLPDVAAVDY